MRLKGKILLFALLAVALWAPIALASTVTLNSSHALQVTFRDSALNSVGPAGGNVYASVSGYAYYPKDSNSANNSQPIIPPAAVTATANAPGAIWLQTANVTTSYNGPVSGGSSLSLTNDLKGGGPNPSASNDGYLNQYACNYFNLSFTVSAPGSYIATLSDVYDLHYGLSQAGGNPFNELNAYSYLNFSMYSSTGGSGKWREVLLDDRYTYPGVLTGFSIDQLGMMLNLDINLVDLEAGETVNIYGTLETRYYGYTVPVPPTVLLLGSGLLGLGLIGVRRRKKP